MVFWGVAVKSGKPFTHRYDATKGRLHVSMASLGLGSGSCKSVLQCNVGDKSPVLLCCLYPEKLESIQLNVEFEEVEDVIFSVIGPGSIHLSGFYVSDRRSSRHDDDDDQLESFGEDIAETESNNSTDDNYAEDSFINDGEVQVFPPSPRLDDEGVAEKSKSRRRLFKASQVDDGSPIPEKNTATATDDKVVDEEPIRNDPNEGVKRRKLSEAGDNVENITSCQESPGLVIQELQRGKQEGKVAISGNKISVRYVCKLKNSGEVVDSNAQGRLFKFRLGERRVIDAWEVGLEGMQVGEIRRLIVPPLLGYGSEGDGKNIPPHSWLVYEIELVKVR